MTFYTSLSGLQAAQTDMSTISHNLANVATNGFKKSRTDFADVIASNLAADPTKMVGSGAVVKGNVQQFSEGNLTTTSSSLDLAVSGDGFFTVKTAGNNPSVDYTRNGSFLVDTGRNVVDAQGSYLQVYPVDSDGNVTSTGSDGLKNLQLPMTSGSPVATSQVALGVNLSSGATPISKTFDRNDASTYNNSTATTIYDTAGTPQTLTSYYVRNPAASGASGATWSVYSFVGSQPLTSGGSSNPITVSFDSSGKLTAPKGAVAFDAVQPGGGVSAQALSLDLSGSTGLSSAFAVASRDQDGKAAGELSGVTVDATGLVIASFSNGDSQKLGKIALANFNNATGLRQLGGSYWASTGISGQAELGVAGSSGFGSLMSGTIEGSNVDITAELVDLIAAQRNFQANAKALDTQSQTTETIFNIRS